MNAGNLPQALIATVAALRSFQNGNSAPEFAGSIADVGVAALRAEGHGDLLKLTQVDMSQANRQHGLSVDVIEGRVVIAIGIDALITAVEGGPHAPEDLGYTILDRDGFVAEIVHALHDEAEDGTTIVHEMLDDATEKALDAGSLCVRYDGDVE